MILFHGTNAEFEAFDPAFLGARETSPANCRLGLWLSPSAEMASRFGKWTLAVEVPSDRIDEFTISAFSKMHSDGMWDEDGGIARHEEFAAMKRTDGADILAVVERDGSTPTMISLRPEKARIVSKVPSSDKEAIARLEAEFVPTGPSIGL